MSLVSQPSFYREGLGFLFGPSPFPDSGLFWHLQFLLKESGIWRAPLIKRRYKGEMGRGRLGDSHERNTRGYAFIHSLQQRRNGVSASISGRTIDCQTAAAGTKTPLAVTLLLSKHRPWGRYRSIKMLIGPGKQYFSGWFLWRRWGKGGCKQIRWLSKYTSFADLGEPKESTTAKKASGVLALHTHVPKQSLPRGGKTKFRKLSVLIP